MKSFKHSGDLGDIIYALPIIKRLGGGKLFLNINSETKFNIHGYHAIAPLLEYQKYINSVSLYNGEHVDYDLDLFRSRIGLGGGNLTDWQSYPFGLGEEIWKEVWLDAPGEITSEFHVISKSERYLNPNVDWTKLCEPYWRSSVFVGLKKEHEIFLEETGYDVPFIETKTLLELAIVIKGSGDGVFIGNCSSPYAIAEGLKKNCIQVVDWNAMSCIYERDNIKYILDDTDY